MAAKEELAAWIGLDWAEDGHEVRLLSAEGSEVESYRIPQQAEALHEWVGELRGRFGGRPVGIALEQKRGGLMAVLMGYEFLHLYPVNPRSLARYREAFSVSGAKDDPDDASLLLDLLYRQGDRLRRWKPEPAEIRRLQLLVEDRRRFVEQRKRLVQQLREVLKSYYPQPLAWFEALDRPPTLEFLRRRPTWERARRLGAATLVRLLRRHRVRRAQERAEALIEQIRSGQALTRDPALVQAGALKMGALVEQLEALLPVIERYDRHIARLFSSHPEAELFQSFKGAGAALAPRLLAALGSDRARFSDAEEVQKWSGIAPVTRRSGRSCQVTWRRGCPKFIRQTFHEFAACSIPQSSWAHAYYRQQRQRGLGHHGAVRALAYKWIRILFRCWQDRTPYDEARYCRSLERRNSPLVALMTEET